MHHVYKTAACTRAPGRGTVNATSLRRVLLVVGSAAICSYQGSQSQEQRQAKPQEGRQSELRG